MEEQGGEQDGAGGIKRADHCRDVESAELGSKDVEEIAERVEHAREYADEPESPPGPGRPGNGDDNQKSRHAGDSCRCESPEDPPGLASLNRMS